MILPIVVLVFFLVLGAVLDIRFEVECPPLYFFMGAIAVIIAFSL